MGVTFIRDERDYAWAESFDVNGKKAFQKYIEKGGDGVPEVYLIKLDPGIVLPAHKHAEDEIEYVLEGELSIGDKRCPAGTTIYITEGEFYGPIIAGPKGVKYLNIQTRKPGAPSQGMPHS